VARGRQKRQIVHFDSNFTFLASRRIDRHNHLIHLILNDLYQHRHDNSQHRNPHQSLEEPRLRLTARPVTKQTTVSQTLARMMSSIIRYCTVPRSICLVSCDRYVCTVRVDYSIELSNLSFIASRIEHCCVVRVSISKRSCIGIWNPSFVSNWCQIFPNPCQRNTLGVAYCWVPLRLYCEILWRRCTTISNPCSRTVCTKYSY
jgi:hypothetical protein